MVKIIPGENNACATLIVVPNSSAGWRGHRQILLALAAVSGLVGVVSLWSGAPVILLFSGAELLLLFFILRTLLRAISIREVLTLTPVTVILQKGVNGPEQEWKSQRLSVRLNIALSQSGEHNLAVVFGDVMVPFASRVSVAEREALIKELKVLIENYRLGF
ncbi:integral membrane protein [Oleiphilus messinensis]|uniref:Integral membrane protein n=1 Tax=Oleiphilus messinensis TaxID=141451 RepID=A0A1Y0ICD1_9GAMM|nr:DUF2244 domain-containing protein [Oleiphilus messinensis]ARU57436.1 integral membrane protein [Oleiphilus messinensis]